MYFLSFIMSVISLGSPIRFSLMVFVVMLSSSVVVIVSVSLFMYWSMSFFVDVLFSGVLVICVVIVLFMCFQLALWYSLIVFVLVQSRL